MKKLNKRILLFLILMLFLASGLSYLGFNQVSTTETEEGREVQTMAMDIALVNEDDGATFNDNEVSFGDAFIQSMDRDESHDWYVVSRGVAESGLERSTYDMMMIVPNDFSEKALSMESESPEQVSLNYKINASGNERVQTEAEKTASEILNDVNRRIVDVYFASIIGNLQDAQDSIGSIVERQGAHTYTYNNSINNPLSSYTDRFSDVQDNTETSKESFNGLEEVLETFEDSLSSQAQTNQNYLSDMEEHSESQEANNLLSNEFLGKLNDFDNQINSENVLQQLAELEAANEAINNQFQQDENDRQTIVTNAATIQRQLENTSEQIANLDTYLQENLDLGVRSRVEDRLSGIFAEALDGEQNNLNTLFNAPDQNARQSIQNQINKLPTLNTKEIEGLGLSDQTVTEMKNVIGVTKYIENAPNSGFEYVPNDSDERETLPQLIQGIKSDLAMKGVQIEDTVKIPEEINESGSTFELKVPDEFEDSNLTLTLNNEKVKYERNGDEGIIITQPMDKGKLTVQFNLKLRDQEAEIDVFQPVTWSWEMDLAGIKEVDDTEKSKNTASVFKPKKPLVATLSTNGNEDRVQESQQGESTDDPEDVDGEDIGGPKSEKNPEDDSESGNEGDSIPDSGEDTENADDSNSGGDPGKDQIEPKDEEDNQDDQNNGDKDPEKGQDETNEDEENGNGEDGNKEDEEEPETVNIINHKIQHKIESELTSDSTEKLIDAASDTVSDYQRMLALYESYFGVDMENDELREDLDPQGGLNDLATKDSLYNLFNQKELAELIKDNMVNHMTNRITAEIRGPIESLQNQIQQYNQLVNEVDDNADQLAENIASTMEQAEVMNHNLEETLADLAAWREETMGLIDEQENVQSNKDDEQTAFMTMGNDLQSIFSETETLAGQADTNLDSADNVYQTFDAIDEQASDIQESGVTLVDQAETLSDDMTETLLEDQNFANNFADVLANSRVGDRQNEDLYDFLSSPVETQNDGVIGPGGSSDVDSENTANTAFTPYYLVLICFIVALFTAYVISTNNQRRVDRDQFAQDKTIVGKNLPLTGLTASIGVVEGLVIGLTSGYFLQIGGGSLFLWVGLITLIMLAMLFVATYLLRQLKMIGMFILLAVLSLYLFLTDALAVSMSQIETVRMFSPLQHVETMLGNVVNGNANSVLSIIVLIGIILIGAAANLFVLHQNAREETEDEGAAEAN
ncbi:type VII secretion EsaA-like protein [Virgibacillus natechei]|uniref:Type VII secretion system accessory factor EsaA n=1 Tax=Virgibacillus natechei TaxID=1216297 RepID=A0ABS4ICQ4_9BACI|nr:type VII secretion protein EsaA [Virgibacillus natechei]MBP1968670.1 type VII secretion EsaA-like protein [Virgibacillus natechei]UZD13771.1 type VII secretion protein EsaA [Virgibacillus natechei]